MGCDRSTHQCLRVIRNFNPRTHRGVRPYCWTVAVFVSSISIHAPIVGCDLLIIDEAQEYTDISIHAPIVGCDKDTYEASVKADNISIHAPIVGCDIGGLFIYGTEQNFNPRTHRGVRRSWKDWWYYSIYFNPRTHRGVRRGYTES